MTQQPDNPQNPQDQNPAYSQQPDQQQYGQYGPQQPGYPQPGSAPSAPSAHGAGYQGYPQPGYPQAPQQKKEPQGFGVLLDLDFTTLKVEKAAKAFYTLFLVIAAVWYLSDVISGLVIGASGPGDFLVWSFLNPLLFGWIVPVIVLIFARLAIELTVASVRTSQKQ
ncbi:DUF4282 domain-containing protein [Nesterenkonia lacusekhoensis]|uniref:DUF4282 domain-containing protein n=1 Tax=Nesterenkonia lacusekhoensis TaxID=150832 RepID=A0ABS4T3P3_9MICC|nr:DUF4282 domain-containing protein [Nesterenkonia lacusekhoensis]MBP2319079.1 hypothetical protein [Nesterenkonia lacusekhoensis]